MLFGIEKATYSLTIIDGKDHVRFVVEGDRTRDTVTSVAREILNTCAQRDLDTVLIDVRGLRGRLGVFDLLSMVTNEFPNLKQLGILKKAAIVDRQKNMFRLSFFESITRRRGYNIGTFVDPEKANLWLCEEAENDIS